MKKRVRKRVIKFLIFLVIFGFLLYNIRQDYSIEDLTGKVIEKPKIVNEYGENIQVYFCPADNCSQHLRYYIENATTSIKCQLYDLDLEDLVYSFSSKADKIEVKLVVDEHNWDEELFADLISSELIKHDTSSQLTHNKFCVFDEKIIWTGSFNPTFRGNYKNNNNVVVLNSKKISKNYLDEFDELWNGVYGGGDVAKQTEFIFNSVKIENYFCPEDWCANALIRVLDNASSSIKFMTFSFTHDKVGEKIIEKHDEGLLVQGVFEKSQAGNQYSEYSKMFDLGMDVKKDSNSYNMHHKVFIIDDSIVVTGSFNPSKNGDTRNDENMLILHDKDIASLFLEEFEKIYG